MLRKRGYEVKSVLHHTSISQGKCRYTFSSFLSSSRAWNVRNVVSIVYFSAKKPSSGPSRSSRSKRPPSSLGEPRRLSPTQRGEEMGPPKSQLTSPFLLLPDLRFSISIPQFVWKLLENTAASNNYQECIAIFETISMETTAKHNRF